MTWFEAATRWYVVLLAASLAFAPFVFWLCRALADRGTSILRPVALLLAVYPGWLAASLGVVRFGAAVVVSAAIAGAAFGWSYLIQSGRLNRDWLASLIRVEAASLASYAAYLWLRGFTPEILGTEKPMDVAFLASSARAIGMPPADPWFAGEPINYYYLGYLLHGTVGRIAGVPTEIGFNLALATIFSMTAVAAFGVARNALLPWVPSRLASLSGLLASFMIALSGNLYAPWRLLQDASATLDAWWWDSAAGIGWRSSRIVCDGPRVEGLCQPPATETINEFPFFSFLLGDLHPHLMALPYTLVAIALAWNLACRGEALATDTARSWLARIAVSGGIVGALYAMNAWDFPTVLIVSALAAWGFRDTPNRFAGPVVVTVAAVGAWLPFLVSYTAPTNASLEGLPAWFARFPLLPGIASSLAIHTGERTSIGEYLTIFGVPYVSGLALVAFGAAKSTGDDDTGLPRLLLVAAVMTIFPGILLAAPILPLCGIPLTIAIRQLLQIRVPDPRAFALAAYSCAWGLSIAVEFFYVRDAFNDRMNTLFKFYFQAWTLYALGAAVTVALLWLAAARRSAARVVLSCAVIAGILAGAAYPVVASHQWTEGFGDWQGLDGLAYGELDDPGDTEAVRWLSANAGPGDVVLEAAGCSYRPMGRLPFDRISAFTGVPTIIGWGDNHQRQWRAGQPEFIAQIPVRQADVASMYADPASPLFDSYGVRWLVVGAHEAGDWQTECPTAGAYAGIDSAGYPGPHWEEAFRSGETRVYRRLVS